MTPLDKAEDFFRRAFSMMVADPAKLHFEKRSLKFGSGFILLVTPAKVDYGKCVGLHGFRINGLKKIAIREGDANGHYFKIGLVEPTGEREFEKEIFEPRDDWNLEPVEEFLNSYLAFVGKAGRSYCCLRSGSKLEVVFEGAALPRGDDELLDNLIHARGKADGFYSELTQMNDGRETNRGS